MAKRIVTFVTLSKGAEGAGHAFHHIDVADLQFPILLFEFESGSVCCCTDPIANRRGRSRSYCLSAVASISPRAIERRLEF